jgi:hypothetical protein
MATERQIEANRRNSARSCGPKTEEGKARSCVNATKHGMASQSAAVGARISPEFEQRRAEWAAEHKPVGKTGNWALDRVVAASLRIERCEQEIDEITATVQKRARLAWDEDQALDAANVAARLARDPVVASRQLQTTLAGVVLLIEAWLNLAGVLQSEEGWSASDASKALDLFGVDPEVRSGQTMIDAPNETNLTDYRKALALQEIERLEQLRDESMAPLDDLARQQAMAGASALLSKPARLVLRYERDAWKHYRESMQELQARAKDSAPVPTPAPVVMPPPRAVAPARPPVVEPPAKSFEEERRALLAEAGPIVTEAVDRLRAMRLEGEDEDAWLDRMEQRIEAAPFAQYQANLA